MHAALTLADRVGITVPLAPHVPYTWRIMRTIGLDRFISDIRPIGIYGADISQRGTGNLRHHRQGHARTAR